jgi:hypothetical protein
MDPMAVKRCTTIFLFGKYSYLRLPMGMSGSADIFQAEMMDLMESLEYVRAYIDDLLCITRGTIEDHLDKLEEVLRRLCNEGLKVNAIKLLFCTLKIKYLDYMLTRGGTKPQIKKVQAILTINLPNNVKELMHFLGMIQNYRDMWAKRSEMLAPLSDLVGECGETKTSRKNKVTKKPWHWDSIHQVAFDNVKKTICKRGGTGLPRFHQAL